jgi:hypothetical protein
VIRVFIRFIPARAPDVPNRQEEATSGSRTAPMCTRDARVHVLKRGNESERARQTGWRKRVTPRSQRRRVPAKRCTQQHRHHRRSGCYQQALFAGLGGRTHRWRSCGQWTTNCRRRMMMPMTRGGGDRGRRSTGEKQDNRRPGKTRTARWHDVIVQDSYAKQRRWRIAHRRPRPREVRSRWSGFDPQTRTWEIDRARRGSPPPLASQDAPPPPPAPTHTTTLSAIG